MEDQEVKPARRKKLRVVWNTWAIKTEEGTFYPAYAHPPWTCSRRWLAKEVCATSERPVLVRVTVEEL